MVKFRYVSVVVLITTIFLIHSTISQEKRKRRKVRQEEIEELEQLLAKLEEEHLVNFLGNFIQDVKEDFDMEDGTSSSTSFTSTIISSNSKSNTAKKDREQGISGSSGSCSDLTWGSVFTQDEILSRIEEMMPQLLSKGMEPAIPISELHKYSSLPLSKCSPTNNHYNSNKYQQPKERFQFQIDLPVKPKGQKYQLYNFPAGSFGFNTEAGSCTFEFPPKGIVEISNGAKVYPLSDEDWEKCLDAPVCQVPYSSPNFYSENGDDEEDEAQAGDQKCLEALFNGKSGVELTPYCRFNCVPHSVDNNHKKTIKEELSESTFLSWILK